jgi:RHH-type proline utilization regulon transcriptional repressor/proline dehydrogenase/delta 1-pyrroline-5-carboxylate dehydrogenase
MSQRGDGRPETAHSPRQPFAAPYAPPDEELAGPLLKATECEAAAERRITRRAGDLIEAVRSRSGGLGGIEDYLRE